MITGGTAVTIGDLFTVFFSHDGTTIIDNEEFVARPQHSIELQS